MHRTATLQKRIANPVHSLSQLEAIGLAFAGYSFWVLSDTSLKLAGASSLPAYEVTAFVGMSIAVLLVLHGLWSRSLGTLLPNNPVRQTLRSLLDVVNGVSVVVALRHVPLALFYVLIFCSPVLTTLLAAAFLGEPLERKKVLAVIIGFLGVVVAVDPFGITKAADGVGYLACVACVLSTSTNMLWSRRMTQTESAESLAFSSGAVLAVLSFAAMLVKSARISPRLAEVMFAAGFFNVLGSLCYFRALKHSSAATVSQYHYSQILTGAIIGYLIWHEKLSVSMLLGAVLIVAAGCFTAARSYVVGR